MSQRPSLGPTELDGRSPCNPSPTTFPSDRRMKAEMDWALNSSPLASSHCSAQRNALLQIILSRSPLPPHLRLLMAFHGWHADSRSKFCLLLLNLVLTYLGHLSRTELCLHIVCFLCACANFSLVLLPSRRHWR